MIQPARDTWSPEAYDAWFESPFGRYAFAVETAALLRAAPLPPGGVVVDVGCGTGRLLGLVASRGTRAVGVDRLSAMLDLAPRHSRAPVIQSDAMALPLATASTDMAVAVALLEFVKDPAAVIAELCRVTRPGGLVALGVLNPTSPWGLLHARSMRHPPWSEARFLTRTRLLALGAAHGATHLTQALVAPAALPGLRWLGPALERLAPLVPFAAAFFVLTIEPR